MDDEHTLREAEARVMAALTPDDAVQRRVVMRALAEEQTRRSHAHWLRHAAFAIATLVLILGVSGWLWRRPPTSSSPSLTVVSRGSMVVVESPDGRRWIIGPSPQRIAEGTYVIAVRE
jgi:hypothetical protein